MSSAPSPPSAPSTGPATGESVRRCPSCGSAASGSRFCAECGASLEGAQCTACRSQLEAGAKFCHRCGNAVGAAPPLITGIADNRQLATALPWALAALALVALIAFVAGRNFGGGAGRSGSASDLPGDVAAASPNGAAADGSAGPEAEAGAAARAPDISTMSPGERADRLYDRVMRLNEEGKHDSVDFFAPMVMAAYQMAGPLDLDQHYDLGRIGEVTGTASLAQAEADTILRADPTHLLGLALSAHLATDAHQVASARAYYHRLVAAAPAEEAKHLPEYARHQHDIDAAMAEARKLGIAAGGQQPAARQ
jgi:hypothetical protein